MNNVSNNNNNNNNNNVLIVTLPIDMSQEKNQDVEINLETKISKYLKTNYKELYAPDNEKDKSSKLKLFKMIGNNNLLFELIKGNLKFNGKTADVKHSKYSSKTNTFDNFISKTFSSSEFPVLWNPDNSQLSINQTPKKDDFRCKYKIMIKNETSQRKSVYFNTNFKIGLETDFKIKKWKGNSFVKTSLNADMTHLIYHTLNFEIQNYINKVALSNLAALVTLTNKDISKCIDIPKFKDRKVVAELKDVKTGKPPKVIHCNQLGKVIPEQESIYYFALTRIKISQNYFYNWTANDLTQSILKDDLIDKCTLIQFIKWSVISKTVEMLAPGLNKEAKESYKTLLQTPTRTPNLSTASSLYIEKQEI